jgi:hypothetical protein
VLDRPLHEHIDILQCCSSQIVECFAPTSGRRNPIRRTVRAGQELLEVRGSQQVAPNFGLSH